MKIAIDLDGTAWDKDYREFFTEFCHAMKKQGHRVGILTAHNCKLKVADLKLWSARGFPEPDFYICKTDVEKSELKLTEGNNGLWKARMVRLHRIDYLFDDMDGNETYIKYFEKEFPKKLFRV